MFPGHRARLNILALVCVHRQCLKLFIIPISDADILQITIRSIGLLETLALLVPVVITPHPCGYLLFLLSLSILLIFKSDGFLGHIEGFHYNIFVIS